MALPLLSTKFNLPTIGDKTVQRPRLLSILDACREHSIHLALVCAPAGYGKTTLVSAWLQTSPAFRADQIAWLTLENSDDDLPRFTTYLITAIRRIRPEFGLGLLNLLQTHKPQPPHVLATLLINELNDLPGKIFLVLDDYHLLTTPPIQAFMQFLVEHLPHPLCLVLISRSDPPLPLARLRARG